MAGGDVGGEVAPGVLAADPVLRSSMTTFTPGRIALRPHGDQARGEAAAGEDHGPAWKESVDIAAALAWPNRSRPANSPRWLEWARRLPRLPRPARRAPHPPRGESMAATIIDGKVHADALKRGSPPRWRA